MRRVFVFFLFLLSVLSMAVADNGKLLLRNPSISKTQIVFTYGGDIWSVSRDGGDARRLTSAVGSNNNPVFSPDGKNIAFTGTYAGNRDVYVIPAEGGQPKRLTYHPGDDDVVGWTPDSQKILFRSSRTSYQRINGKLFTLGLDGGFPTELPLPIAEEGALSPDGMHIAYVPHTQWQPAWKRYRGGQTTPIWIANLTDSSIERIPRDNSNDFNPMWIGNTVYFLSDRNGPVSLFAYDMATKQVSEAVKNDGLDFKSASAGPDAIVIEQFGGLKLYDLNTKQVRDVAVRVAGDVPALRPQFVKVEPKSLQSYSLSPAGVRAVVGAWGEIFTIPSDKGDIRNLTNSPAVADRDPAWSPDGKYIAYLSDEPGEYELQIREQNGMGKVRHINLGNPPSFFYSPVWAPDSKKIAYTDKRLNLWYVDLDSGKTSKVDSDYYDTPIRALNPAWSPDSKWLTYTKQLASHLRAVYVYSLESAKAAQVTDGMSDCEFANFDKNGKYLYFTSSTDVGLSASWLDMSSLSHPITRSVYVAVLSKDDPSPLAPESDEEKIKEAKKAEAEKEKQEAKSKGKPVKAQPGEEKSEDKDEKKKDEPVVVKIDLDGIGQRIVALPIPPKDYQGLSAGKTGIVFLAEGPEVPGDSEETKITVQKFDLTKRKVDKFMDDVSDFVLSSDGSKILYKKGEQFGIASTDEPPSDSGKPKPGEGPLKLDAMQVYIDPPAMWKQIYRETWRIERDFLYDPNHHGLDLQKVAKRYEPYLENVSSRDELTYLFTEALGELTLGHVFVGGGYRPDVKKIKTGLLGADYSVENGRYRVARVYNGENWNPDLLAPLTQPGVKVKVGDYILAVNGREVKGSDDIYSFFEDTAGKQVLLKVASNPEGKDAREVTVIPVDSETNLRRFAWIEGNRRKVDELSGGKVAYVYLPDTAEGGFTNFNRYYFAQVGKKAAVIDERFNQGGDLADYIIDNLRRPVMSWVTAREGADFSSPGGSIYGPKVMIINEMAGSGGDAMPWYFHRAGVGQLVGKKTWGGLVGIYGYPDLIDGGYVTAPRVAIYGLNGDWEVENHGVAPDVDVDFDPAAVRQGHDPQLEKAVELVLQELKQHPFPDYKKPAYPNYHANDQLGIPASQRTVPGGK